MKKSLLFVMFFALSLFSAELAPTKYSDAKAQIGKGEVVMLEVGSIYCHACKDMGELLSKAIAQKPSRKIFFVDVGSERAAAEELKIRMIPTQIVYDANGKEIDRHIGGFTADGLNKFLAKHKI
jgi:thioredoxin 1